VPGGVAGGVLGGGLGAPPPPPPPPKAKAAIRVGGNVQNSKLIQKIDPIYPELAKRARVSGIVLLQVTVDEQGTVGEIKLIRGHPLLNQSAIDAVGRWRYSPTLLNGEPVRVIATVTVNFVLR
jgi:protein TonB